MTIILTKKLIVTNWFGPVTGAFDRIIKNSFFNQIILRYLLSTNAFRVSRSSKIRRSINSYRLANNQIPIDLLSKQVSSQSPAVSSLEAYQTPAR